MSGNHRELCLRPTQNQRFLALTSVRFGLESVSICRGHMGLIRDQNGNVEGVGMLS